MMCYALKAGLIKFKTGSMTQRCANIKDDNKIYWTNNTIGSLKYKATKVENKNIYFI